MLYLRTFWHFMSQKRLHQRIVYLTIAKNFAIVLQYNSKVRIVLLQYSKKKLYILFTFSSEISLSSISLFQFSSLFVSPSALSSLEAQTPFFLLCGCFFFFLGVGDGVGQWWLWVLAWVTMVVVVFFFFGCDQCLKGLWVVVGSGV